MACHRSYRKSQALSLEGNFDRYFTLYAPVEYKADALYVFTPDVMACLIDEGAKYDMEIIDDELYIYHQGVFVFDSSAVFETLLGIIDKIGAEVRSQTNRYTDDVAIAVQPSEAVQGKRQLKSKVNLLTGLSIIIIGLAALGAGFYAQSSQSRLGIGLLVLVVLGATGYGIMQLFKK